VSASIAFCSTRMMETSSALIWRMTLPTSAVMMGDRPIEGSSSSKSLGRLIRARAIASICCSPPLMEPAS
jgi:hypothetical protein